LAKALKEKLGEALDAANDKLDDAKRRIFTDFATSVSDGLKEAFSFRGVDCNKSAGKETVTKVSFKVPRKPAIKFQRHC
jgi:hypothetical protein